MKVSKLIVASTFVASAAFAATAMAGDSDHFSKLDADGNGMISTEEAAVDPQLVLDWDNADVNKDGQLERAEFSALEEKPHGGMDK